MNELTRQTLEGMGSIPQEYFELLDADNEKFDAVYPEMKPELEKALKDSEYQEGIINVSKNSNVDIAELKNYYDSVLEIINKDTDLSDSKKDMMKTIVDYTVSTYEQAKNSYRINIPVKIVKLSPSAIIPEYAHPTDAGADIYTIGTTTLAPNETKIVKTGLAIAVPAGYEVQIRPRSGNSLKTPLRIANAPGTIDTEYRGEIGIIVTNTSDEEYTIKKGTKIAQMLIAPTPMIKWEEVSSIEELGETDRGKSGFGSTGQ